MSTHPGMLVGYDADGNILATLDYLIQYDETGKPLGLVDFAAQEEAGGALTDIWTVDGAAGSTSWPEYLGSAAHQYRVDLHGPQGKRPGALVHKETGERRERSAIHARIAERIANAHGQPADIRDIVGGPDRPLRTKPLPPVARPNLPLVAAR